MMRTIKLVLAVAISLAGVRAASAQSGLTQTQRDAILGYSLTLDRANHLISAMSAVTQYLVSQPDYKDRLARSAKLTAAEQAAQMEKDPKVSAILKENGLTARDYLVGVPTLRMALLSAQGLASPNIVASPANVAFAKANLAQLKPKMDQADGLGRPK
jgi:hypothetical protein